MTGEETSAFDYYKRLLNMDYDSAVNYLKKEHGKVQENYFGEKSYNNFIKGYSKNLKLKRDDKTSEGLYRHHIAENKYPNLGNKKAVKSNSEYYDFNLQEKECLVYCNLIEHIILHILISESNAGFGSLKGIFNKWIIKKEYPKKTERNFYNRIASDLTDEQSKILWDDYFNKNHKK